MMPGPIQQRIVANKVAVVRDMGVSIATLPLASLEDFREDPRMVAAGESFLRRALEAVLDLGRHILAKGFGTPAAEYREIGRRLGDLGVLSPERATLLVEMGGYRNRLTHFYSEVTPEELYRLLTSRRDDLQVILDALLAWIEDHPEKVDPAL